VRFQDVQEIDVLVDIPETVMAGEIRRSDVVEMVAEFSGAPGIRFPVQIREVAQVADPVTQTFAVRAAIQSRHCLDAFTTASRIGSSWRNSCRDWQSTDVSTNKR
jgi:hypothetical protein